MRHPAATDAIYRHMSTSQLYSATGTVLRLCTYALRAHFVGRTLTRYCSPHNMTYTHGLFGFIELVL
jgi:hypothetical protein